MNRRTSLKYLFVASLLGAASATVYKLTGLGTDLTLTQSKKDIIAELAELIIPKTDTPGAKDAKVDLFIIDMILTGSDRKTQYNFINGLDELDNYALNYYQHKFLSCDTAAKLNIMKYFEKSAGYSSVLFTKISNRLFGKSFFTILKELTVEGYCTSQAGAVQGLDYDYIPGAYIACLPLKPNQKSWATK